MIVYVRHYVKWGEIVLVADAALMECRPSVVVYGAWNFSTPPS